MSTNFKIALALYCIFATGCRKISSEKETAEAPDTGTEQAVKKLLPLKFESDKLIITFKYQDKTAFLTEISGTDGYLTTASYKDQQAFEIKKYRNGVIFQLTDYVKDKSGLPKARSFEQDGPVYKPDGYYLLHYNNDNLLEKVRHYDDGGALFKEVNNQYTSGNITKASVLVLPNRLNVAENTYDLKNGVFRHLRSAERIFLENRYIFLHAGRNNLLSSSSSETAADHISCSYEYNTDQYPSVLTVSQRGVSQKFKITYTELKE